MWGGAMGATFTVGLTLVGQRFRGVQLIAANAVFTLLFGIGGLLGPFVVGSAMGRFGPARLPDVAFLCCDGLRFVRAISAGNAATRGE